MEGAIDEKSPALKRSRSNSPTKEEAQEDVETAEENDESDEDGERSGGFGRSRATGRKNIRRVILFSEQDYETRKVQNNEILRQDRLEKKHKFLNAVMHCRRDITPEGVVKRLILDADVKRNVLVEVRHNFLPFLKRHQADGIRFLYDSIVESIDRLNSDETPSGAILAHSMGLGKTLQAIVFIYTLMTNKHTSSHFKRIMIVVPSNVAKNWVEELNKWLVDTPEIINLFEMPKKATDRLATLQEWHEQGGILIMTLTIYSLIVLNKDACKSRTKRNDQQSSYLECLVDPGPDLVVVDEGHFIKNKDTRLNRALTMMKCRRRVILTGTPLQNNLSEYFVMVDFVYPRILGSNAEFVNRFQNPIINGEHSDSEPHDVHLMKKRVHILYRLLQNVIHRCDYHVLVPYLPPKYEYVLKLKLSEVQKQLYGEYLNKFTKMEVDELSKTLFVDYCVLGYIWNHPFLINTLGSRSLPTDIASIFGEEDLSCSVSEDRSIISADDSRVPLFDFDESERSQVWRDQIKTWVMSHLDSKLNVQEQIELSAKFVLLMEILNQAEHIGDKVLVFSQSLVTLDLIERFLADVMYAFEDANPTLASKNYLDKLEASGGFSNTNSWVPDIDFLRIDGRTSVDRRMELIHQFNNVSNRRCRVMLVSTRAGGVGINLVGANRCIIFDSCWNPAIDLQAIFRIYRYGQVKPVYIYRLVSFGTMEHKIYDRQIQKLSLSHRVIDEQQIRRHFTSSDLEELYTFNCDYEAERQVPLIPNDSLLKKVMLKHKDLIIQSLEHDSLLQNRPEEHLSQDERSAAWKEFALENKKALSRPKASRTYSADDTSGLPPDEVPGAGTPSTTAAPTPLVQPNITEVTAPPTPQATSSVIQPESTPIKPEIDTQPQSTIVKPELDTQPQSTIIKPELVSNDNIGSVPNVPPSVQPSRPIPFTAVKKQPVKKELVKKQPAKKQPAKKQPAKKQPAKKQPVKKQPAKKQPVKKMKTATVRTSPFIDSSAEDITMIPVQTPPSIDSSAENITMIPVQQANLNVESPSVPNSESASSIPIIYYIPVSSLPGSDQEAMAVFPQVTDASGEIIQPPPTAFRAVMVSSPMVTQPGANQQTSPTWVTTSTGTHQARIQNVDPRQISPTLVTPPATVQSTVIRNVRPFQTTPTTVQQPQIRNPGPRQIVPTMVTTPARLQSTPSRIVCPRPFTPTTVTRPATPIRNSGPRQTSPTTIQQQQIRVPGPRQVALTKVTKAAKIQPTRTRNLRSRQQPQIQQITPTIAVQPVTIPQPQIEFINPPQTIPAVSRPGQIPNARTLKNTPATVIPSETIQQSRNRNIRSRQITPTTVKTRAKARQERYLGSQLH